MKKIKILIVTLLGVIALVCACLAAGCKFSYSLDEIKNMYGLSAQVTYFLNLHKDKNQNYNGGKFNDSAYIKDIYYKEGEVPLNLGSDLISSGGTKLLIDSGYNFTGWYKVATDSAGNLLYEDGTVYSEDDEFNGTKPLKVVEDEYDFTKPLAKDEHIYLCGGFYEDVKLRFKFFCAEEDFDVEYKTKGPDDQEVVVGPYKAGTDVIEEVSFIIPQTGNGLSDVTSIVDIPGYTVIDLYENSSDAQPFSGWPIAYPEPDETGERPDVILYAKLLKDTWQIVRTPSDVEMIFTLALKTNYYVLNDVDCGGMPFITRASFNGQIYGGKDGHVISNFVAKNPAKLRNGASASLFGNISADAIFRNIAFKDFSVEFEVMPNHDPNINFFARTIADGATFDDFTISGELKIKIEDNNPEVVESTINKLSIHQGTWVFGSDKVYEGITVEKAVCTINDAEKFKVEKIINLVTINTEVQL